jgi:trimeric autotransporter adhesin
MSIANIKTCLMAAALLPSIGSIAYSAQPPDVVVSDANGNTAMGSNALLNNVGQFNTASGSQALLLNTTGFGNTANGYEALGSNSTGSANTATGFQSLWQNTTGSYNTAYGLQTLIFNTTGEGNTASGYQALLANTTGQYNTAAGNAALSSNTIGSDNTATGSAALYPNTTGNGNTATASAALGNNTTGSYNTATGFASLNQNTIGSYNTGTGVNTLIANSSGVGNVAMGFNALASNTTAGGNTAVGTHALELNTGNSNVALGANAAANLTTGSNNIDIANAGVTGESGAIRIGTQGEQSRTFIAGIWGSVVRGLPVFADSAGRLGVVVSSERYKTDIVSMSSTSDKLLQLRPVTFHLKTDPTGDLQFGLIAEEVAKVYPELVVRDDAGKIQGVRYDELAPILLSEVQQQQRKLAAQASQLGELRQQFAELRELNHAMQMALAEVQAKQSRVAMR